MNLLQHIDHKIKGLFLKNHDLYREIDFFTRRDLFAIAKQFKNLYDLYSYAIGNDMLHLKLITDYGLVDINIYKINYT
jgi:hypothetical protein